MFKIIRIISVIFLIGSIIQHHSLAQVINEKTVTNTPYASVLQCTDDSYIYIGTDKDSPGDKYDVILTKIDINGDIKWKKNIPWTFDCSVKDAVILPDNSIIIAGSARKSIYQSYPFIIKTDPDGKPLWTRYYEAGHQAEKVLGTFNGEVLFTYYSNGSHLMKLNSNGDSIWSKKVGNGKPYGLAETTEAVYLLVEEENENIVLNSIGSYGEVLWKKTFGGPGRDRPADVINASNGDDYLFAGTSYSDKTNEDFFIGLVDCFGYINWTKTFGGPGTDLCYDLMETSTGDFIAVGVSNSFNNNDNFDFYVVKFDSRGNTIWTKTFPITINGDYLAQNIFETSYGSFVVAGPKNSGSAPTDESYIFEFIDPAQTDNSSGSGITSIFDNESNENPGLKIQPNPFNDKAIISFNNPDNDIYTFRITDLNGKLVKQIDNIRGSFIEFNRSNLPSGIYFIELSGKNTSRARLLIQ